MRKPLPMACLALLISTTPAAASTSQPAIGSGRACDVLIPYKGRVTFTMEQRVAMAREEHAKVRALANARLPTANTMILIMFSSAHHTFTNLSYVATRDKLGVWTVDRVGRTTSEFPDTPPEVEPATRSLLTTDVGKSLDALIADDCLYAQPFMTADDGPPPLNGWSTGLAIITPKRKFAGSASGPIPSIGGKVVTAVTGW